jgi:DNA-binding transcriptional LysR family regulator
MDAPVLNLRRLYYFCVLAEERHFGRAAARLHMAQPGLSQQIKQLEAELGVTLIERGGRENRLTPAGELLHEHAVRYLRTGAELAEEVEARARGSLGRLTIAYTRSAVYLGTTEMVRDFRERRPDVQVRTTSGWTTHNLEMLHEHEVDAAFVRPPLDDPTLDTLALPDEELVVVLPTGHPLADEVSLRPEQLHSEKFVFWPRKFGPGHYDRIADQVWHAVEPDIVLVEPDDEQILAAVAAHVGISVLERARATRLCPPGVTLRRFADPAPKCGLALAWRSEDTNPVLRAFVTSCRRAQRREESRHSPDPGERSSVETPR